MDADTANQLLHALRDCGLFTPEKLAAAGHVLDAPTDPALADRLQALGLLTPWQYRKIRAGRGFELLFGPYLVLDRIGEGGMGKVYRAIQQRVGRVVALKVIRPQLMNNKTVRSRYRREAKAAAALDHPNVVKLYDADEVHGRYFLSMEYIDGIDLSRLVKEFGNPPAAGLAYPEEACEYARQAALGLQHAHAHGLVHRDIKPSNLLVYGNRALPGTAGAAVLKILDMGLVRSVFDDVDDDASRTELTRDGTVVGTPDYMAPEQAKNSSTVDHRADLYALGCTLYFLLKGQPPFPDGSPIDKLLRHQLDPVPDLRRSRPDVPQGVADVIARLVRKNPAERYQSAAEVAAALAPFTPAGVRDGLTAPAAGRPGPEAVPFSLDPEPAAPLSGRSTLSAAATTVSPAAPPTAPPSGKTSVRLRVVQSTAAAPPVPARPSLSVKPDATPINPTPASPPTLRDIRRVVRPPADDGPAEVVSTRRTKKPAARKPAFSLPLALGATGLAVLVLVAGGLILARGSFRKEATTQPTQPGGGGGDDQAVVRPQATALSPVADLLPDRATAVLVAYPQPYRERAAADPVIRSRVTAHLDGLAERTGFDPRKFDRMVVAFVGRPGHFVAVGEAASLTPTWADDTAALRQARPALLGGQKGYEFTDWVSGPRYAAVLAGPSIPAFAVAEDKAVLDGLANRVALRRPPAPGPADLLPLLAAAEAGGAPSLVTFVAGPGWELPDGDTLARHHVSLVAVTVRLDGSGVAIDLTIVGRTRKKAAEFLSEFVGLRLPEQFPGLKTFAEALTTGQESTRAVGEDVELRVRKRLPWKTLQTGLERVMPD